MTRIGKNRGPISREEIERGRKLLLKSAPKVAELLSPDGPPSSTGLFGDKPRHAPGERLAIAEALDRLAAAGGDVSAHDVELLGKQLGHAASTALAETFRALETLRRDGHLIDLRRAETVDPAVVDRLEKGTLPKTMARHVLKTARYELFRLFDHPIKDEKFHFALGKDLRARFGARSAELEKLEQPLDLTLRERGARQTAALRAVLFDPAAPDALKLGAIERLGRVGDSSALPSLERATTSPALAKAAKAAIAAIHKASKMTIVLASMEAKPYCGTGGLSNVMAELPKALAAMGHRVIVLVPRHEVVDREKLQNTGKTGLIFGPDGTEGFGLFKDHRDGVDYYFIENDRYFSQGRGGIYGDAKGDYPDNAERYDFFGAAIPAAVKTILGSKAPDVIQLNDAHTASAAAYIKRDGAFEKTKTIMAVHNLGGAYQGKFNADHLPHLRISGLGLYYPTGPAEFYGQLNFMKLGLMESDGAITVSRQYKNEILNESMGEGLQGCLRVLDAKGRLWGNLNGIDNDAWNSETDPLITHKFSIDDLSGKKADKAELQAAFGLDVDAQAPLVGVVARLTNQKGFDDILESMSDALEAGKNVQFVVVGQGDPAIAAQLNELVEKYPGKVAFDGAFTTAKEHAIYAGSDFFLMPSKFEPCGLPQMYALRYATVPIVRGVGGLEESIRDFNPKTGEGNGFKFSTDLSECLSRALSWYEGGESAREALLRNCVSSDFSWETTSAPEQVAFYRNIINRTIPTSY